jgi:hypothetical protein
MKSSLKVLIKGLLVIVLFTGTSVALSTAGVETVSEARAAVSYQQVNQYLVNRGYTVITLSPVGSSTNRTEDWVSHTVKNNVHYTTTVYVQGTEIVGSNDVVM